MAFIDLGNKLFCECERNWLLRTLNLSTHFLNSKHANKTKRDLSEFDAFDARLSLFRITSHSLSSQLLSRSASVALSDESLHSSGPQLPPKSAPVALSVESHSTGPQLPSKSALVFLSV